MLASHTRPRCCRCVPCGLIGAWAIFALVHEGRYFNASGMPDGTEVNATLEFTGHSRNIPAKSDVIRITGGHTLDGQSISYQCVYARTQMHDCTCFCMTMRVHPFLCVSLLLMHARMHACMSLAHAYVCAGLCTCVCVCMFVSVCVCLRARARVRARALGRTHAHVYSRYIDESMFLAF